jgi:hypothetical protein
MTEGKTVGNFNGDVPVAKIVVTFVNSERAPINIEIPELLTGGIDTVKISMAIMSLVTGATAAPVGQHGTGVVYFPEGRRPAYERFVWARASELDPEPPSTGLKDTVSFHPDDLEGGE